MIDYNLIKKSLLINVDENRLIKNVKELQKIFNTKKGREDYSFSEELVSAYTLFYMPTNMQKIKFLFDQLKDFKLDLSNYSFIDFGSGPGTFSLAFLKYWEEKKYSEKIFLVDKSEIMLKQAKSLYKNIFPDFKNVFFGKDFPEIEKSILFFGNSINEMGISKTLKVIEKSSAEYIIWIEPGTKEFFHESFLKLREEMISMNYLINYPCLSEKVCSMSDDTMNWCHQVLRIKHQDELLRLGQICSIDRRSMPFNGFVGSKRKVSDVQSRARIIRFLKETKFSYDYEVCLYELIENKIIKFEITKKEINSDQKRMLKKLCPGDTFRFLIKKIIFNKHYRISLK